MIDGLPTIIDDMSAQIVSGLDKKRVKKGKKHLSQKYGIEIDLVRPTK